MDLSVVTVEPLGERAYILRGLDDVPPFALAAALNLMEGVEEAVPSYEAVGVFTGLPPDQLLALLSTLKVEAIPEPRAHAIPCCYALGPDLEEAASSIEITPAELVELHSSEAYRCFAIGFQPGFPFLGYLPRPLQGLPRRDSPRAKVPVGSVGITGKQTGIYPSESPGGWSLIGRTPLCLVDLKDAYFPIAPGDLVRFEPIDVDEFRRLEGRRF